MTRNKNMKTTRILLADNSGVLNEAALRLRRLLPNLPAGACAVRSAEAQEPLTQWHPDLVLLDPNRDENGAASPPSQASPRVLVLSLSYEDGPPNLPARSRRSRAKAACHLACVSAQAVEMGAPLAAGGREPQDFMGTVRGVEPPAPGGPDPEDFRPRSPGFSP